ncbi:gelsolin repeat protein [Necator americanus]|uniref:Gelsolin repeat protein n=1 Tax=Necator americanus TaxID=51031 RepID=W2T426_NECAM|nr:gelsolin repeat protein [Necator americanus]ETN75727.1 gelsolin repeat protein [Necator americanus]
MIQLPLKKSGRERHIPEQSVICTMLIQPPRIQTFTLEPVPKNEYGQFYIGDAYVCLNTKHLDQWDIHFWLGEESTTDEIGTAAIKTVEIDQALGGWPVQHREIQNHESALFLSYFPNGIRYIMGGYDSGYHHVEDMFKDFKPRLYHCKGKRNVRCTQVEFKKESLNLGDVFLLDLGREIYVWMPPESGRLERIKGMARAKNIADLERTGQSTVHILGSMKVTKVAQGEMKQSLLDTKDAFILDAINGGIFVWVGKGCTLGERAKAMIWGENYLREKKLPPWTQVTRVLESVEPTSFTQWYVIYGFLSMLVNVIFRDPRFGEWEDSKVKRSFEPRLFQVSDESGKMVVEEIANFNQESLDGDDVMILDALYTIYVWVGAGANQEEKKRAHDTAKVLNK